VGSGQESGESIMKGSKGIERKLDRDEAFMHEIVISEEQRRQFYPHLKWTPGQFRWFETPNVVDLWRLYSAKEKAAIYRRLSSRR
jgi:hypothetical protein